MRNSNAHVSTPADQIAMLEALLAAVARNDIEELMRLTETSPASSIMMWTAKVPTASTGSDGGGLGDFVRRFWDDYAEANPRPIKPKGTPIEISVSPGMDPAVEHILRTFIEGGDDA